ncbi:MAG: hypothetical protein A3C56_07660 [Ignavibacteria bacterium RIFCSPHIGHO2_02_FULL_56_12]|nr:MAG: hypothetical protein A3C56_07660 [Ignavibacteria bacterium RIFCSPHIGHO2_02_FULL_56_12]
MTILNDRIVSSETDFHASKPGTNIMDFNTFLDHIMKNFSASFPYGLNKTDVTRIAFQSWCTIEAQAIKEASAEVKL